jgi:hypothetical protein
MAHILSDQVVEERKKTEPGEMYGCGENKKAAVAL